VGLLPVSKINSATNAKEIEARKTDDPIPESIEAIHTADRKISLAPADAAEKGDWQSYKKSAPADSGMGDLGEKLKAALKSKQ
jgi:small subunit ribosomal protein S1